MLVNSVNKVNIQHNRIEIAVGRAVQQAILDTGSCVSLLRQDFFNNCRKAIKIVHPLNDITHAKGVSGKLTPIVNKVTLTFKIVGLQVVQIFYCLEQISHPILLGLDFMNAQKGCT